MLCYAMIGVRLSVNVMSVKIHAMPPSQNSVGPAIMAQHIGCGGLAMCNLMEGAHKTEEFTKINPYQHIPTLEDGDFSMGESNAIFRYLALKYKPELYPTTSPEVCGKIDFAMDAFVGEVYKHHMPVVYVVMGFRPAGDDQAAANKDYSDAMTKWAQVKRCTRVPAEKRAALHSCGSRARARRRSSRGRS